MTVTQTSTPALPDGWERVDEPAPYHKYVARDAVDVRDHNGDLRYRRDVVILANTGSGRAGVAKGPCYRNSWPVNDPDAAARRLAREIQSWLDEGNGPYGDDELEQRLENAATNGGETA